MWRSRERVDIRLRRFLKVVELEEKKFFRVMHTVIIYDDWSKPRNISDLSVNTLLNV